MKGFIGSLISRHLETGKNIMPRLPGRYEDADNFSSNKYGNFAETNDRLSNLAPSGYPPYSESNPEKPKAIPSPDSQSRDFSADVRVGHSKNYSGEGQRIRETNEIPGNIPKYDSPETDLKQSKPGSYSHLTTVSDNLVSAEKTTSAESNPFLSGPLRINGKAEETDASLQKYSSDQKPKLFRNADKIKDHSERVNKETSQKVKPISERLNIKPADPNPGGVFGTPPGSTNSKPNLSQSLSATFGNTETRQVIKVTIGQINVRAVMQSAPAAPQKPKTVRNPAFTLEDYLKQRTTE